MFAGSLLELSKTAIDLCGVTGVFKDNLESAMRERADTLLY